MHILYHHRTRATDAQRVHILEIVNAFEALGHQVEMAALASTESGGQDAARDAEVPAWQRLVRRVPLAYELAQIGYKLVGLALVLKRLLWGKFDFIYERYSLFNFAGVLAALLSRKPIIVEVNSPLALELGREKAIHAVGLTKWTERVICNLATKVIVVSGPLRRIMLENGVNESKLVLMPNGVNLEHLGAADPDGGLRRSLGLEGRVAVGFVGWFKKWHGLEFLLEAFGGSRLGDLGAALLLIGDGPAMPDLKRYVEANGLGDSVVFTGAVPHERIPPFLGLIDIAVQPAANEYCCPMKIIEYMGLGKAIVAPRQENIAELLGDGSEALLFEPGDERSLAGALRALITDREERRRLGERALAAVHERGLLWTANARRILDLVAASRRSATEP
jgi:glycosyltransferase involved in cell wall biosynthesis